MDAREKVEERVADPGLRQAAGGGRGGGCDGGGAHGWLSGCVRWDGVWRAGVEEGRAVCWREGLGLGDRQRDRSDGRQLELPCRIPNRALRTGGQPGASATCPRGCGPRAAAATRARLRKTPMAHPNHNPPPSLLLFPTSQTALSMVRESYSTTDDASRRTTHRRPLHPPRC
jgi:hypothetical protein